MFYNLLERLIVLTFGNKFIQVISQLEKLQEEIDTDQIKMGVK